MEIASSATAPNAAPEHDIDHGWREVMTNQPIVPEMSRAGLSSPSAAERMRRLQERGVIRAYTVELNAQALGFALQALVRVRPLPGKVHIVEKLLAEIPEVCECDKVTGEDCFVARVVARSIEQLDEIIDRIAEKAETNTSIVKSQPILRRPPPLTPPAGER